MVELADTLALGASAFIGVRVRISPAAPMTTKQEEQKRALNILQRLKKAYPNAGIVLKYKTPMQLVCAVMLSAQTTDNQVNKTTENLFKKYTTPKDFSATQLTEFEKEISSINLYRTKAKNILNTANIIQQNHNSKVPKTLEELVALPGIGRKTANVVLWEIYNKSEGIVVDTHVKRVSQKLNLSHNTDPTKIEKDLMNLYPKKEWGMIGHYFQAYGRTVARAKGRPTMDDCLLGL